MNIAIIPARGGSKRIPQKNIKYFCGKPIIVWSIETASASNCFDKIIVSTDDDEIAAISRNSGAEVPFSRPANLSGDYSDTISVIRHAIRWIEKHNLKPEYVCCIYPTAPFMLVKDLKAGLQKIIKLQKNFVFTATTYAFPIQRAFKINQNDKVEMFNPENFTTRSQDLESAFHDAGQFYWGRANAWLKCESIFTSESSPLILPRYRVLDIDTKEDWAQAEMQFKALRLLKNP